MSQVEMPAAGLFKRLAVGVAVIAGAMIVAACTSNLPDPPKIVPLAHGYLIGAGDGLRVFVWQNSDLTTDTTVRPDGMISLPLIHDIRAAGKTPTQLAQDIGRRLKKYVTEPVVTVMVNTFVGLYSEQIRVVGEAVKPEAIPYRKGMTVLDAMIAVGGLTQFADGDRATLVRTVGGVQRSYRLHLDELLRDGHILANVPLAPGDVITIPQTYF
jgi:polysaccharide export outer membrane protein